MGNHRGIIFFVRKGFFRVRNGFFRPATVKWRVVRHRKAKFMLATTDNTRGRPKTAADVVTAEEAGKWFTRPELAAALKVSVSTIDRMVKSEDLPCVRLRGRVRFYLPVVVVALCKGDRKFGRKADTNFTNGLPKPAPSQVPEVLKPLRGTGCQQGGQAS
jgi:excisionase family DNA binding protein